MKNNNLHYHHNQTTLTKWLFDCAYMSDRVVSLLFCGWLCGHYWNCDVWYL